MLQDTKLKFHTKNVQFSYTNYIRVAYKTDTLWPPQYRHKYNKSHKLILHQHVDAFIYTDIMIYRQCEIKTNSIT